MGLAGTKHKIKIGLDPNNTQWSNDESRFGRRHLDKLGWRPGQGLGTGSSGSKGSSGHVKIRIKADNSGIGGKKHAGRSGDDGERTAGLDAFQQILGKLNGKGSAEIERQSRARVVAFTSARYSMDFILGEILERQEHDQVEDKKHASEPKRKEKKHKSDKSRDSKHKSEHDKVSPPKKKRKRTDQNEKLKTREAKISSEKADDCPTNSTEVKSVLRGRQATRVRWIAQKRAALADAKGLSEILMIH